MAFEDTLRCVKMVSPTLNKMVEEGKATFVKIEFGRNIKVMTQNHHHQEPKKQIKTVSGRNWNPYVKYLGIPYGGRVISKEIYPYVSRKTLAKIENPLDNMKKEEGV